jgi:hypothetical protein
VGFIDRCGKWIIEPRFSATCPFAEGLSNVEIENSSWGYIDKAGGWVIKPQFSRECSYKFNEGLAFAEDGAGKTGVIDKTGNWVIAPTLEHFENIRSSRFSEGFASLTFDAPKSDDRKRGILDRFGHWLVEPENRYERIDDFDDGLARITLKDTCDDYFIDKQGRVVWPVKN